MTHYELNFGALTLDRPGAITVSGTPEGYDAFLLSQLAMEAAPAPLLYVAPDDSRLANMRSCLAFFAPDLNFLSIPAWDCLPYDRISPRNDLIAERIASLVTLSENGCSAAVVLVTVNSLLQRVPPRDALTGTSFTFRSGENLAADALFTYLEGNGFTRSGTVMEAGDYAVRGGIVDIFPPGSAEPVRLDLFGDFLETIKE